jgi:hypothetical protein
VASSAPATRMSWPSLICHPELGPRDPELAMIDPAATSDL